MWWLPRPGLQDTIRALLCDRITLHSPAPLCALSPAIVWTELWGKEVERAGLQRWKEEKGDVLCTELCPPQEPPVEVLSRPGIRSGDRPFEGVLRLSEV